MVYVPYAFDPLLHGRARREIAMSQAGDFAAFLKLIAKAEPGTPPDETSIIAAFNARYAAFGEAADALMRHCQRSPFDFNSPAEDYRRAIALQEAWQATCAEQRPVAAELSAAGLPAFAQHLVNVEADTAGALSTLKEMASGASDNAGSTAKIVAAARADAFEDIARLSALVSGRKK